MSMTLDALASECKRILTVENTPGGRKRVAGLLSQALRDPAFVREQFASPVGERKVAYQDPDLGFCILVHEYRHAREGKPHDHGEWWAIYGQAEGESVMSEFEVVAPGQARELRSYAMRPGDAHVYDEGAIHAVRHPGPSKLVRIEGRDLATVKRGVWERV